MGAMMDDTAGRLTVDVIIPTYKPGERFGKLLVMLRKQTYPIRQVIIINTEEKYWNKELEKECPNLVLRHIKKEEFDHGNTRHTAVQLSHADVFLCMTDDALPCDTHLIEEIVKGFGRRGPKGEAAAMVYARQLPKEDCGCIERYTRRFNYPGKSRVKTKADISQLGIKTYFASNVCCAYSREIYDRQGGFIRHAIFNEDMIYAGHAVQDGYCIVYQARARVEHSHNYGCIQQFKRNFDLAVSQADHPEVFSGLPSEKEGIRLVRQTGGYLIRSGRPWLLAELAAKSGFKYLGYLAGKHYRRIPLWLVKCCTMNPTYWRKEKSRVCGEAHTGGSKR